MDFGLAYDIQQGMFYPTFDPNANDFYMTGPKEFSVGKYFYMAPELYLGTSYDAAKADMWSLGILLLILLTGTPPFAQANTSGTHEKLSIVTHRFQTMFFLRFKHTESESF